jgi:hypothetical protein
VRESAPPGDDAEKREIRLSRNEQFFRECNELTEQDSFNRNRTYFICECSRRGCLERISLSLTEYEHIRAEGNRFFVAPGHDDPTVEAVSERHPTYLVVTKDGPAGIDAELSDPRDGDD